MRIPSARTGQRAWVLIYPLQANHAATRAALRSLGQPAPKDDVRLVYHVRRLEAEHLSLGQILQMEEGSVRCIEEFFVYGDQHLCERLEQRGFSIGTFYPLTAATVSGKHGIRPLRPVA